MWSLKIAGQVISAWSEDASKAANRVLNENFRADMDREVGAGPEFDAIPSPSRLKRFSCGILTAERRYSRSDST
jgi:hypothetical protein